MAKNCVSSFIVLAKGRPCLSLPFNFMLGVVKPGTLLAPISGSLLGCSSEFYPSNPSHPEKMQASSAVLLGPMHSILE